MGLAAFFSSYNLAEETGYAGVLSLGAGAELLPAPPWRGAVFSDREDMIYVVIGVVGMFATWGSFTPLGHIFRNIPLFGSTRLQSRNVILVDFPLAIMLGWWLQHVRDAKPELAGLGRRARWVSAAPALIIVALSVALIGWGPWLISKIYIANGDPALE